MTRLSLSLLGPFEATLGTEPIADFRTRKVQALLIFLAAEPEAHSRDQFLTLLWPGMPEKSARSNLRQVLYYLRRDLPEVEGTDGGDVPVIKANRHEIQLNPAASVSVDSRQFEALLDQAHSHDHLDVFLCQECAAKLEDALALYRGNFLSDFYLDDSSEFEEWAQAQRQYFRRRALDTLGILTTVALRRQDYGEARAHAEQQLELDSLRESAYRQLMEALALSGRREQALAAYERCRRVLAEELGMAPSARTTDLHDNILAGDLRFDRLPVQGVRGYELKEQIGAGSYAVVHRAVQPAIRREVAVKVIRRHYSDQPEFVRRFEAEAQTVAQLEHPHIVPLYDYWRDPEGAYLVMRYLRGGNLLDSLEDGPWAAERAASMLKQIAAGLASAHRRGIVHRDIKPANILLDQTGNAYLADFGIVRNMASTQPLTGAGLAVPTLHYVSPEQIMNEPTTPQTDIYSLGVVLYVTLTGEKPFPDTSMGNLLHCHLHELLPLITTSRPDIPPKVDTVVQKATAKEPGRRYETVLQLASAFNSAVRATEPEMDVHPLGSIPPLLEVYNPYKGLHAFQESDADDFFGRESLLQQLLHRLTAPDGGPESRFLALVGPSGSGKSSVVKAALIPALRAGALPGSEKWYLAEMVPGVNPLQELELALRRVAVDPPPNLVEPMQLDTSGILRTVRRILPAESAPEHEDPQLLLVIDQFEELFTLVEDAAERAFFMDSLLVALEAPRCPLRVVVTLRADFYDRPLQYRKWGRLLKQNTEIILPLNRAELTRAIREPARRVGVHLEEGLAATIVDDVADQPGALPLLQYAMTELFEKREGQLINRDSYEELGGVLGALGRRAEALYLELGSASQEVARQLFLRLITLSERSEDTRRRVLRSELEALTADERGSDGSRSPVAAVLDRFGAARFLTFDRDPLTRAPTVEVAHEALIREWRHLRSWLAESRDDVRLQRRLAQAAREWLGADRDPGYLLRDTRLQQFADWAEVTPVALTDTEHVYLAASVTAQQEREALEEARRKKEEAIARRLAETERQRAQEQVVAEQQARLAKSRELSLAALRTLDSDPELSILVALQALDNAETKEAEEALHQALQNSRVQDTFNAPMDEVYEVAFSPDQKVVAASGSPKTVSLWDTEKGEQLLSWKMDDRLIAKSLAFNPNGDRLLMATIGGEKGIVVRSWDLSGCRGGQPARQRLSVTLPIMSSAVNDISLNPKRQRVATGLDDGSSQVWELSSGQEVASLQEHDAPVNVTFSSDGSQLLTLDDEGFANLWSLDSKASVQRIASIPQDRRVYAPVFSADGTMLLTGLSFGVAAVWDLASALSSGTIELLFTLDVHTGLIIALDFSPDGTLVATTGQDDVVVVHDISGSKPVERYQLSGHNRLITDLQFSPDGKHIATASRDGTVRLWDARPPGPGELLQPLQTPAGQMNVSLSADGRWLASGYALESAHVWDLQEGELILTVDNLGAVHADRADGIYSVDFHSQNGQLVTAGADGYARVWDVPTGQLLLEISAHDPFSVTGNVFFGVKAARFAPDGSQLATAGADGFVKLWDPASGELLRSFLANEKGVQSLAYSPDGTMLATGLESEIVKIWNANTGDELLALPGHNERVQGLAFTPDGQLLATGAFQGQVKVWDLTSAHELYTLPSQTTTVFSLHFSPDGQHLVTGGGEAVRIWDVASGEELLTLIETRGAIVYGKEGRSLYFLGDGQLHRFALSVDTLVTVAHERLTRWWTPEECRRFLHQEECPPRSVRQKR